MYCLLVRGTNERACVFESRARELLLLLLLQSQHSELLSNVMSVPSGAFSSLSLSPRMDKEVLSTRTRPVLL